MSKENEEFDFKAHDSKSALEFHACRLLNGYSHLFEPKDEEFAIELWQEFVKKYIDEILIKPE